MGINKSRGGINKSDEHHRTHKARCGTNCPRSSYSGEWKRRPNFVHNFNAFVRASPGTYNGLLSSLIQQLVLPNIALFASVTKYTELVLGIVLLLGAIEVGRRRLGGPIAAQHGYEAPVAAIAALAGLAAAGLSLSIALMMGEQLPTITPGRALTTAIPVELLLVPLGIAVAWMEAGRFRVLSR